MAKVASSSVSADELKAGRITSIQISLTVLSDFGVDQLRSRKVPDAQRAEFLAKNGYQYCKVVQIPSM